MVFSQLRKHQWKIDINDSTKVRLLEESVTQRVENYEEFITYIRPTSKG